MEETGSLKVTPDFTCKRRHAELQGGCMTLNGVRKFKPTHAHPHSEREEEEEE